MLSKHRKTVEAIRRTIGEGQLPVLAVVLHLLASHLLGRREVRDIDAPCLYNALVMNAEALRLDFIVSNRPAWRRSPQLSSVLNCLMHALTCDALGEAEMGQQGRRWLRFAVDNQKESRPHFSQRFQAELRDGIFTSELLETIHDLRHRFDHLDVDDGPYPSESFPAHLFAPEKLLLTGKAATRSTRTLQPEIEELVVLLNVEIP